MKGRARSRKKAVEERNIVREHKVAVWIVRSKKGGGRRKTGNGKSTRKEVRCKETQ